MTDTRRKAPAATPGNRRLSMPANLRVVFIKLMLFPAARFNKFRANSSSREYSVSVDVGNVRSYTLQNRSPGTHYFSVTAYDAPRNESTFSNEVSKTIR